MVLMAAKKTERPVDGSLEDTRARLVALRDRLERALHGASENMLPQLAGRYQAVIEKLAELPAAQGGPVSKRDELKERRERKQQDDGTPARRRAAPAPARAAGEARGKRGVRRV